MSPHPLFERDCMLMRRIDRNYTPVSSAEILKAVRVRVYFIHLLWLNH